MRFRCRPAAPSSPTTLVGGPVVPHACCGCNRRLVAHAFGQPARPRPGAPAVVPTPPHRLWAPQPMNGTRSPDGHALALAQAHGRQRCRTHSPARRAHSLLRWFTAHLWLPAPMAPLGPDGAHSWAPRSHSFGCGLDKNDAHRLGLWAWRAHNRHRKWEASHRTWRPYVGHGAHSWAPRAANSWARWCPLVGAGCPQSEWGKGTDATHPHPQPSTSACCRRACVWGRGGLATAVTAHHN